MQVVVYGTRYENRDRVIRLLRRGSQVSLTPDPSNSFDQNAIKVTFRRKQLGWIPKEMNILVKGLAVRRATIVEVGTDDDGFWRHVMLKIYYVPYVSTGVDLEMTHEQRDVLSNMHVKDTHAAKYIASLPMKDQQQAIEEWDQMNLTSEKDNEVQGNGDDDRLAAPSRSGKRAPKVKDG